MTRIRRVEYPGREQGLNTTDDGLSVLPVVDIHEQPNDSRLSCGRSARGRNAPAAVDVVYWRTNGILPYIVAPASSKRLLAGGFCHGTKLVTENACPVTKSASYFGAGAFSATTWRSNAPLLSTKNTQSEAVSQLVVCR